MSISKNKLRTIAREAESALAEATDYADFLGVRDLRRPFWRALEACEAGEKQHRRAVGSEYRTSVKVAVALLVAGKVLAALDHAPTAPTSWASACDIREDVACAYAVAEGLRAALGVDPDGLPKERRERAWGHHEGLRKALVALRVSGVADVDYAGDVAVML